MHSVFQERDTDHSLIGKKKKNVLRRHTTHFYDLANHFVVVFFCSYLRTCKNDLHEHAEERMSKLVFCRLQNYSRDYSNNMKV